MKNIFECYFIKFAFSESNPTGMSSNSVNHPPRPTCTWPSAKFTLKSTVDTYSSCNILCHCFKTQPWNFTYTSRNYNLQELSFTRGNFAILLEYQMAVLLPLRWGGFSPLADSQDKTSASGQCPWYQNDGASKQKTPSPAKQFSTSPKHLKTLFTHSCQEELVMQPNNNT